MQSRLFAAFSLLVITASSQSAFAWAAQVHRLVCEVPETRMTISIEETRAQADGYFTGEASIIEVDSKTEIKDLKTNTVEAEYTPASVFSFKLYDTSYELTVERNDDFYVDSVKATLKLDGVPYTGTCTSQDPI